MARDWHMLRTDTSPVKDRIKQISDGELPLEDRILACGNTKEGMEKREGKAISVVHRRRQWYRRVWFGSCSFRNRAGVTSSLE